ncbi:murein L,D-transpeptidase catalytic domain family protein [Paraflavitalea pollutisoli]|uniref:murein L,D-transpeptidase catalytic domain family protein n=1 Tax=Paraflavitalea pollutisoli TaxID=3034143 RepID=UPI0023EDCF89|nr:murein L,D-transpeptidase catalytic domain family protein [Paraflavitalea sp. H1-2-19X]
MYRPLQSIVTVILILILASWPVFMSGSSRELKIATAVPKPFVLYDSPSNTVTKSAEERLQDDIAYLFDSLRLEKIGLTREALEYGLKGYRKLMAEEGLTNDSVLSIVDFSQSSRKKRLYVIDLARTKLLINTYVAHGKRSGKEYAQSFSNVPESFKSSLGFYITRNTYQGANGLSLNIDGLEQGINDKAFERRIVVHSSRYVGNNWLKENKISGTSLGCPAVPVKVLNKIIETIKGGSCLFIYHPTKYYLTRSNILNG